MALSIKDPTLEKLARQQAKYYGTSITQAITDALRLRAEMENTKKEKDIARRMAAVNRIVEEFKQLPVYDTRSPEEIINEMWEE